MGEKANCQALMNLQAVRSGLCYVCKMDKLILLMKIVHWELDSSSSSLADSKVEFVQLANRNNMVNDFLFFTSSDLRLIR